MIKVVIADDHKMIREGLKQILELDGSVVVVGSASNGNECLDVVNRVNPDVVLLDINMPEYDGMQVLRYMRSHNMNFKVIVLTLYNDIDVLQKVLSFGVDGYVLKDSSSDVLKYAIEIVNNGGSYIEPVLSSKLTNIKQDDLNNEFVDEVLSHREIEILKNIAVGKSNKEVAVELGITERTVKNHLSNIFKKINVMDRTQAAVYAIKHNLINI